MDWKGILYIVLTFVFIIIPILLIVNAKKKNKSNLLYKTVSRLHGPGSDYGDKFFALMVILLTASLVALISIAAIDWMLTIGAL